MRARIKNIIDAINEKDIRLQKQVPVKPDACRCLIGVCRNVECCSGRENIAAGLFQ